MWTLQLKLGSLGTGESRRGTGNVVPDVADEEGLGPRVNHHPVTHNSCDRIPSCP